ncbi:YjcZ family sporulation protein [Peribacillus butanolivorans]|uniref:YjcZ family sporulation protein n=1 Tax=Peribacillus butanolivorans TaxID=421767 RepID=UPI0009F83A38|nr:YjcZ family sporulation protein [Peribacillus butanolivorans]MCO0598401.1 YjcZ family sporulation protein [Peribacillus butanolivorans]
MYGGYTQDCCYPVSAAPSYGYGGHCGGGGCFGGGFALIIVLFILLIIVGACFC